VPADERADGGQWMYVPDAVIRHEVPAGRGRGISHALRAGTVLAGIGAAGFGGAVESLTTLQIRRRSAAL
jgi:hypothetical protein